MSRAELAEQAARVVLGQFKKCHKRRDPALRAWEEGGHRMQVRAGGLRCAGCGGACKGPAATPPGACNPRLCPAKPAPPLRCRPTACLAFCAAGPGGGQPAGHAAAPGGRAHAGGERCNAQLEHAGLPLVHAVCCLQSAACVVWCRRRLPLALYPPHPPRRLPQIPTHTFAGMSKDEGRGQRSAMVLGPAPCEQLEQVGCVAAASYLGSAQV